jgi:hypothetical protein
VVALRQAGHQAIAIKADVANAEGSIPVFGAEIYAAWAIAGLGLIQCPHYRMETQISQGLMQEVLIDTCRHGFGCSWIGWGRCLQAHGSRWSSGRLDDLALG